MYNGFQLEDAYVVINITNMSVCLSIMIMLIQSYTYSHCFLFRVLSNSKYWCFLFQYIAFSFKSFQTVNIDPSFSNILFKIKDLCAEFL